MRNLIIALIVIVIAAPALGFERNRQESSQEVCNAEAYEIDEGVYLSCYPTATKHLNISVVTNRPIKIMIALDYKGEEVARFGPWEINNRVAGSVIEVPKKFDNLVGWETK